MSKLVKALSKFGPILYVTVFIGYAALMARILHMNGEKVVLEAAFISLLVLVAISIRTVRSYYEGLPGALKLFTIVFVSFMLFSHILNKSRATFPFVCWSMYTTTSTYDGAYYLEYIGIFNDEEKVFLIPDELFPSLDHEILQVRLKQNFQLYQDVKESGAAVFEKQVNAQPVNQREPSFINQMAAAIRNGLNEPRKFDRSMAQARTDEALRALIRRYNLTHHEKPIVALEVFRNTPHLNDEGVDFKREMIWRTDLAGGA